MIRIVAFENFRVDNLKNEFKNLYSQGLDLLRKGEFSEPELIIIK